MKVTRVVYIDYNFIDSRYPNKPEDGDRFYTYGFGSLYARQFKKYNPDIHVECWKADPRTEWRKEKDIEGVIYRMFPSTSISKIGQYSRQMTEFLRCYKSHHPDAVFNISSFDHVLFYSLSFHLKKNKLVVQHHGESTATYKFATRKGFSKLYWALRIPIERMALKNIKLVYMLDTRIEKWLPGNIKKKILRTTGVDENIFYPISKEDAREQLSLRKDNRYLLYVGRLNITKHPEILIKVFNDLKNTYSDLELILAGSEKKDPFYRNAEDSGARIYGVILNTELYKFLSAADVYVLPKLDESIPFGGIGMLSVQALLCNTPIVGSTVEAFPVEDRDNVGIVADDYESIKNAVTAILEKKKSFSSMRDLAIKHYSWEKISMKTYQDYLTL